MINLKGWVKEQSCFSTKDKGLIRQALISMNTFDFVQVQGEHCGKKQYKFPLFYVKVEENYVKLPQQKILIALSCKKCNVNLSKSLVRFEFDYGLTKTTLIFRD